MKSSSGSKSDVSQVSSEIVLDIKTRWPSPSSSDDIPHHQHQQLPPTTSPVITKPPSINPAKLSPITIPSQKHTIMDSYGSNNNSSSYGNDSFSQGGSRRENYGSSGREDFGSSSNNMSSGGGFGGSDRMPGMASRNSNFGGSGRDSDFESSGRSNNFESSSGRDNFGNSSSYSSSGRNTEGEFGGAGSEYGSSGRSMSPLLPPPPTPPTSFLSTWKRKRKLDFFYEKSYADDERIKLDNEYSSSSGNYGSGSHQKESFTDKMIDKAASYAKKEF